MLLLNKLRKIRKNPENPETLEIKKAERWLAETHRMNFVCYGFQPFIYLEASQKGEYKRYHFFQEFERDIVYVVLSDVEKNEIQKCFCERMEKQYEYKDTILYDNIIVHRFVIYERNMLISNAYMFENEEVHEGTYI